MLIFVKYTDVILSHKPTGLLTVSVSMYLVWHLVDQHIQTHYYHIHNKMTKTYSQSETCSLRKIDNAWHTSSIGSTAEPVFSYKLQYITGFGLVEKAISTYPEPTIYRPLCERMLALNIRDTRDRPYSTGPCHTRQQLQTNWAFLGDLHTQ